MPTSSSVQEWRHEFKSIHGETVDLSNSRYLFRRILQMIRRNPDLPEKSVVYHWLLRGYVHSASAAVRRQVDVRKDTISLRRLLTKISARPLEITRECFVSQCPVALQRSRERDFNRFAPRGSASVSREIVRKDLNSLVAATEPIKKFTDERIAHHAATRIGKATFPDLDYAIDVVEHLVKWYGILLYPSLPLEISPGVKPEEWRVFQVPWIRGSGGRGKKAMGAE